jgi:aminopeptidase N
MPRGAYGFLGPEEVILTNEDRGSDEAGIWYLAHHEREYRNRTANSEEDKRTIDAEHYKIETVIDSGEKLTATAELSFTALVDGERVLHFGLLPALRVTRVTFEDREVDYIQEKEKEDGAFNVILPVPLSKGTKYKVSMEYQGHKVVEDAGGGNFAVGARTSWYPSVNAFNDRATFDLTFKVPKRFVVVGVGKLVKEWTEGGFAASQWVSDIPLAVAGFNYGLYKKKQIVDPETKYTIESYVTAEPPAYLRRFEELGSMSPASLADRAIVEAQNSVRIFSKYFGDAPYGRIAITQQPAFSFGQSWPTLVYLPVSAFLDSTQRYMIMGGINSRLTDFVYEVGSHEVSHQWWGHMVGWASYHDQWLSEGFASFSAGLFLQLTEKTPDKFIHYLEEARTRILEKNEFGSAANDAGPIWMGLRLSTPKVRQGYRNLVYPKGGYILHMLRQIMWDRQTGDKAFIDMMHDFVQSRFNENASTESFKHIVEKHITKAMDVDKNGKMDWFFDEWVYGSEVPSYHLEYSIEPENTGKFLVKISLAQSGVSDRFVMPVPIYVEVDGKPFRLGEAIMVGNSSIPFKVRLDKKPKRAMINAYQDVLAREVVTRSN